MPEGKRPQRDPEAEAVGQIATMLEMLWILSRLPDDTIDNLQRMSSVQAGVLAAALGGADGITECVAEYVPPPGNPWDYLDGIPLAAIFGAPRPLTEKASTVVLDGCQLCEALLTDDEECSWPYCPECGWRPDWDEED
jgi:hypothetical protein